MGSHGHTAPALFHVVVRLVTHGDLLFLYPAPQLAVGVLDLGAVHRSGAVLEDTPYRMEQTVYRQNGGGQGGTILPLQQNLGVSVPLLRRLGQLVDGLSHVPGDILALPVQFAQQIFSVGIARLGRHCELGQGLRSILILQKFFGQTVGSVLIPTLSGPFQPADALFLAMDFYVVGQQQFAHSSPRVALECFHSVGTLILYQESWRCFTQGVCSPMVGFQLSWYKSHC